MTKRSLVVIAFLLGLVLLTTGASEAATNRDVARRIARQLNCAEWTYYAGTNATPGSRGQLDCSKMRQEFIMYIFPTNAAQSRGVNHWKAWSGPYDTYYFAKVNRAIITPQGKNGSASYTRRWALWAAERTNGTVFSGKQPVGNAARP